MLNVTPIQVKKFNSGRPAKHQFNKSTGWVIIYNDHAHWFRNQSVAEMFEGIILNLDANGKWGRNARFAWDRHIQYGQRKIIALW